MKISVRYLLLLFFLITLSLYSHSFAADKRFSSAETRVSLIELYTSEGCSSCPPAEKWMNALIDDPQLWQQFVPVAFHVDYWDYIGWKDPFADKQHGLRQRQYKEQGNIFSVYTPGVLLNGKEWRKWRYARRIPVAQQAAGTLDVEILDNRIKAVFTPADGEIEDWELNIALLGFDLRSNVRAGENAGRSLEQEFVVLNHVKETSSTGQWQLPVPVAKKTLSGRKGLAAWVNKKGSQTPLQATGGWL